MDQNFALNGSITTFTRLEWYKAKEKRHSLLQSCPQRLLVVRTTSTLFATTYVLSAATVEKLLGVTNEVHKFKANSVWRVLPSRHSITTSTQADKENSQGINITTSEWYLYVLNTYPVPSVCVQVLVNMLHTGTVNLERKDLAKSFMWRLNPLSTCLNPVQNRTY